MASTALTSLARAIDQILNHPPPSLVLPECVDQQLRHLLDQTVLLQSFLQDLPEEAIDLSERMRTAANDAIECIHLQKKPAKSVKFACWYCGTFTGLIRQYRRQVLLLKVQRVSMEIDAIIEQVKKIKHSLQIKDVHMDTPFPFSKDIIVDFEDDWTAIKNPSKTSRLFPNAKKDVMVGFDDDLTARKVPSTTSRHRPTNSFQAASTSNLQPVANKDFMVSFEDGLIAIENKSSSRLHPSGTKDVMVGFDDDLMAIKSRLCGESSKLQVIPIFGMGGIGKTTLARNAYDDPLTVECFQIRAWVTVSQEYSVQDILSTLLVTIKPSNATPCEQHIDLMAELYKSLKGWRYLIVMDDMWNTEAWDDVKGLFPDDCNASRIILTTRLFDVATYAASLDSSPPHEVNFMDDDQSWNLLRRKVFGDENCPARLKTIGKTIARSCKGLPLAIVVIAGLLATVSKTEDSWEDVARNVNQALTANVEQFADKVLSLSYKHLPPHLSPCFLYMGLFPEDCEIYTWNLFKLWEAEGFLELSGSTCTQEKAEDYLEDLVRRSLVLVTQRKTNGKIKSCSVHDLVRELCIRKAKEDKFLAHVVHQSADKVLPEGITNQHRIYLAHSDLACIGNSKGSLIHTLMCYNCHWKSHYGLKNSPLAKVRILDLVLPKLRILELPKVRVLDVVGTRDSSKLLDSMQVRRLKYLAVEYGIDHLPSYIPKLQNLHTLIIHPKKTLRSPTKFGTTWVPKCRPSSIVFITLPPEVWRMPQLRHLISFVFNPLPDPEEDLPPLVNLQTLSVVRGFTCNEKIQRMTPNLKKLAVIYYKDNEDSDLQGLKHLHQLEKFKLQVPSFHRHRMPNLTFPNSLRKLALIGCHRRWEDMVIVSSLPNLEILKLKGYAFTGAKWETAEDGFRQLEFLLIDDTDLEHWITDSDHFPRLRRLVLYRCWRLSEIPECIGEIPTLEEIKVDETQAIVESAKRIQKALLENWGNDALKVSTGR